MIVGRVAQLAALDLAVEAAEGGRSTATLLVGDPGMGATTLLQHTRDEARRRRFRTAAASAPDSGNEVPFALVHDLLTSLLAGRHRTLPAHETQAAALEPAHRTPGAMSTALLDVVVDVARRHPVLVTLDNLQWADEESAATIAIIARRLVDQPVALVAATRPPVPDRYVTWTPVELPPMGVDDALRLLRQVADGPVDEWAGSAAVRAWGGNPSAIVTCHRLLTPDQLAGRLPLPDPAPVSDQVRCTWSSVVASLPIGARRAVEALCVLDTSRIDLVSTVLADVGCSLADVDAARATGLVTTGAHGAPAVTSPLVRAAVLSSAPRDRVRAVHRVVAQVAAARGAPPSIVISHLRRSALPGDEATADLLVAQAELAARAGQPQVAARAYNAAADLSGDLACRRERALTAARLCLTQTTSSRGMSALLGTLESVPIDDPHDRVWLEWLRSEVRSATDLRQAAASALTAAQHAKVSHTSLVPWLLWDAAASAWSADDPSLALDAARQLAEWADHGSPTPLTPAWLPTTVLGVALLEDGQARSGTALLRDARTMATSWRPTSTTGVGELINVVALDDLMDAEPSVSDARVSELISRVRDEHDATLAAALVVTGWRALRRGDLAAAEREASEALDIARAVAATPERIAGLCLLVTVQAWTRRWRRTATLDELRHLASRAGHRRALAEADRAEGLMLLAEGRSTDAVGLLHGVGERRLRGRSARDAMLAGRVDLLEASVLRGHRQATGDTDCVQATLEALGHDDPRARGLLNRSRALLTLDDPSPDFERSAQAFAEAGDDAEQGRTRLLHAEHLRRHHQPAAAREEASRAWHLFTSAGAHAWAPRAEAEAGIGVDAGSQTGLRYAGTAPASPLDQLTGQERRVAEAICAGGTTRDVAEALVLSPRTVESHLGQAYRKLGVHNRAQLANLLRAATS